MYDLLCVCAKIGGRRGRNRKRCIAASVSKQITEKAEGEGISKRQKRKKEEEEEEDKEGKAVELRPIYHLTSF